MLVLQCNKIAKNLGVKLEQGRFRMKACWYFVLEKKVLIRLQYDNQKKIMKWLTTVVCTDAPQSIRSPGNRAI